MPPILPALSTLYGSAAAPVLTGSALVQGGGLIWWQAALVVLVSVFLFSRIAMMLIKIGGAIGFYLLIGGDMATLSTYFHAGLNWLQTTFEIDLSMALDAAKALAIKAQAALSSMTQ